MGMRRSLSMALSFPGCRLLPPQHSTGMGKSQPGRCPRPAASRGSSSGGTPQRSRAPAAARRAGGRPRWGRGAPAPAAPPPGRTGAPAPRWTGQAEPVSLQAGEGEGVPGGGAVAHRLPGLEGAGQGARRPGEEHRPAVHRPGPRPAQGAGGDHQQLQGDGGQLRRVAAGGHLRAIPGQGGPHRRRNALVPLPDAHAHIQHRLSSEISVRKFRNFMRGLTFPPRLHKMNRTLCIF